MTKVLADLKCGRRAVWALGLAVLAFTGRAKAATVESAEILVGQCAALSGPAAALGTGMKTGLDAAFNQINAKGGVQGRKVRLISADDGYEPEKTVDCTGKMIEESHVFVLAGYVGTPTSKVAVPIAQEMKVPLIAPFSGAALLRTPVQRYVLNLRASYDDETEALVANMVEKRKLAKIAVFYQNDAFGAAGLGGVEKALAKRHLQMAAKGSFERNTLAVKSGLASILEAKPDAVVIVGPYKPTAEFVRQSKASGLNCLFAAVSFVGTESLIGDLGKDSDGMMISQVVPSPAADLPLSKEYREAMAGAPLTYVSFEGYVAGRWMIKSFEAMGPALDQEKLIDAMEQAKELDLGGLKVSLSSANHQGSSSVFLTEVRNNQPVSIQ